MTTVNTIIKNNVEQASEVSEKSDVKFKHYRFMSYHWEQGENEIGGSYRERPDNLGGYTLAYYFKGDKVQVAFARCAIDENFNKDEGRKVSLERLNKAPVEMTRDEWEEFKVMNYDAHDLLFEDIVKQSIYGYKPVK